MLLLLVAVWPLIRGDRTLLARAKADPSLRRLRDTPVWSLLGS